MLRGAGAAAAGAAFLCTTNRGKLLQHKLIHVQCTKKIPEYRYPLYPHLPNNTRLRLGIIMCEGSSFFVLLVISVPR